jgi:hypothetical protein
MRQAGCIADPHHWALRSIMQRYLHLELEFARTDIKGSTNKQHSAVNELPCQPLLYYRLENVLQTRRCCSELLWIWRSTTF